MIGILILIRIQPPTRVGFGKTALRHQNEAENVARIGMDLVPESVGTGIYFWSRWTVVEV